MPTFAQAMFQKRFETELFIFSARGILNENRFILPGNLMKFQLSVFRVVQCTNTEIT